MIFGKHRACDVDLAAADVGMQVDRARHDDASGEIVLAINGRPWRRRRDNAAGVHEQIAHFAIDSVSGIVDPAAAEPDQFGSFMASRMPLQGLRGGRQGRTGEFAQVDGDDIVAPVEMAGVVQAGNRNRNEHRATVSAHAGAAKNDRGNLAGGWRAR